MNIKRATVSEYDNIMDLYCAIIAKNDGYIGWKQGIYPSKEFVDQSIAKQNLFLGFENSELVSSMVLNHSCNEEYRKVKWAIRAKKNEVLVIHILGVHPNFNGKGYAKKMVKRAIEYAKENNQKTIRLDVLEGNSPAEHLYTSLGFTYVDTQKMFYEDTGWTNFKLYEYLL